MNSNLQKLAYAYGNLREKTASPGTDAEMLIKLKRENEAAKPWAITNKLKDMKDYMSSESNMETIRNRAAVGATGLGLASGIGALGGQEAKQKLRDAGFGSADIDDVLTTGGSMARGAGSTLGYGAGGAGLGYGAGLLADYLGREEGGDSSSALANVGATLGGIAGAGFGAYRGYAGETERADEAIADRQMDKLMRAAKANKKSKRRR